jgi:hypothetical protein
VQQKQFLGQSFVIDAGIQFGKKQSLVRPVKSRVRWPLFFAIIVAFILRASKVNSNFMSRFMRWILANPT